jgi:3-methyl-2-oxobutanoate hydroxymethyltransferase
LFFISFHLYLYIPYYVVCYLVDAAEIDVLLVGDSLGMVELGHDTTLPVTVDQMIYHCQAVGRGANFPLLVADM